MSSIVTDSATFFQTAHEYMDLYNRRRGREYSKFHGYAYDGIWVIAKAVDTVLKLSNGRFTLQDFRSSRIQAILNDTNFQGVTVSIARGTHQWISVCDSYLSILNCSCQAGCFVSSNAEFQKQMRILIRTFICTHVVIVKSFPLSSLLLRASVASFETKTRKLRAGLFNLARSAVSVLLAEGVAPLILCSHVR